MSTQPDNWPIAAEGRRQIAWRRLLEAALRHGEQILAEGEREEQETQNASRELDGERQMCDSEALADEYLRQQS